MSCALDGDQAAEEVCSKGLANALFATKHCHHQVTITELGGGQQHSAQLPWLSYKSFPRRPWLHRKTLSKVKPYCLWCISSVASCIVDVMLHPASRLPVDVERVRGRAYRLLSINLSNFKRRLLMLRSKL